MRAALPAISVPVKTKMWRRGPVRLDQGQTPHCVAFAGGNWEQGWPIYTKTTNDACHANYAACKTIDGIPNEDGTYDRALMKVLQAQGRVESYHWAANMTRSEERRVGKECRL